MRFVGEGRVWQKVEYDANRKVSLVAFDGFCRFQRFILYGER